MKRGERCPDLADLADGLSEEHAGLGSQLALAQHLAECPRCSAIATSAATRDLVEPAPELLARLEQRARALYRDRPADLLRLVVRALGRTLEVLDLSGARLAPVPLRTRREEGVLVRHRFGPHDLTAHVTSPAPETFAILLDVWGEPERSQSVRLSLFRGDRELASEVPRKGRVMFPPVRAGRYRVVLQDPTGYAGELDLTLQDAA